VTHANKLYFSRQTRLSKLDIIRYYLAVHLIFTGEGLGRKSSGPAAHRDKAYGVH
jgi:DNA primase